LNGREYAEQKTWAHALEILERDYFETLADTSAAASERVTPWRPDEK
jgi:hypothetical protein